MAFKKNLRKAKEYVREEVNTVENVLSEPQEQRLSTMQNTPEFQALMVRYEDDMKELEAEQKVFSNNNILKHKLVHLFVSGRYTNVQIARLLNVHPTTISRWLSDEDVRNAIENYQQQEDIVVGNTIKALRLKALGTINELMDSDNELVALQASKDILDRSGHKGIDKKEIKVELTYEERIKQALSGVDYVIYDDSSNEQINTEGEDVSE